MHKLLTNKTNDKININLDNIDIKTLEKQMKVFNYYYNKNEYLS